MTIRNSRPSDWDELMEIYARARQFMKETGNPLQWKDTDPAEHLVRRDIELGHGYVCEIDGRIQCVFAFIPGEDPTYKVICRGMSWDQVQKIREACPTAEVEKEL